MKKMTVLIAFLAVACVAQASININWTASAGFYWDPSFAPLIAEGSGGSTLAQLVYSSDAVIDAVNADGSRANDTVLDFFTLTETPGDAFDGYAYFNAVQNHQDAFSSGNVYAVIFQDDNIGANDWYYYTPLISILDITGAAQPQSIEMNTDLVNGNAINSASGLPVGYGVGQVVPEPATALLFGIGGLGAFIVRRNKKKAQEEADA